MVPLSAAAVWLSQSQEQAFFPSLLGTRPRLCLSELFADMPSGPTLQGSQDWEQVGQGIERQRFPNHAMDEDVLPSRGQTEVEKQTISISWITLHQFFGGIS